MDTDVWLPIATLVGGAVLTYVFQSRQNARQHERDKERDERQYEREQERRRRDWERQVTLDLMDAFGDLYKATVATRLAHTQHYVETDEWSLPDNDRHIAEYLQPAHVRCETLIALVEDEELASQAIKTKNALIKAAIAPDVKAGERAIDEAITMHNQTIRRLGALARSF